MTKLLSLCQAAAVLFFCAAIPAGAQDPTAAGAAAYAPFSADALDQLLRPIALYPDPLLAEIFTAATVPAQIVMADRYVNSGSDLSQIAAQPWDPSVQALAHYPTVLKWLDDNLPWTTEVGEAFLNQQQDVMASIQHLRLLAQGEGNLQSTPQENVVSDSGTVEIEPANPELIYVPIYPWDTIYYDPGVYCSFGVGFPIGLWLTHDWDWRNHRMIVWGAGHLRPANWWSEPPRNRVAPAGIAVWHAPVRVPAVAAGAADRGFAAETLRPARLAAPPTPAPPPGGRMVSSTPAGPAPGRTAPSVGERVGGSVTISGPSVSRSAPEARAPSGGGSFGGGSSGGGSSGGGSFSGGVFGGSESSFEARQSSVRGVESRSTISAPSPAQSAPQFSRPSQPSGSSRGR